MLFAARAAGECLYWRQTTLFFQGVLHGASATCFSLLRSKKRGPMQMGDLEEVGGIDER